MADKKISELIDNTNPSGDNIIPIVASGVTMKQSLSGLSAFLKQLKYTLLVELIQLEQLCLEIILVRLT
jgi:hypothetical protein